MSEWGENFDRFILQFLGLLLRVTTNSACIIFGLWEIIYNRKQKILCSKMLDQSSYNSEPSRDFGPCLRH
ncbi:hypothetical protein MKW92_007050 [Papaver armeniacum]|nr:hypothetical protein MKW92_007050 [Papaver armeniacum]